MESAHVTPDTPLGTSMGLTAYVRDLIGQRDQHLRAATEIDSELKALHAMLAEDIPGRGPERVWAHRQSVVDQAVPATGAGETVSHPGKRKYQHRPTEAECDALILAAVDSGLSRGREIAKACDLPWETLRQELYSLVDRGVLSRTGQTQNTRYTRATVSREPQSAPVVAPVTVPSSPPLGGSKVSASRLERTEAEFETVWRPHRDAPSLIGSRVTKASTL